MIKRMTNERFIEIDKSWSAANICEAKAMLAELLYGMEAERQRVRDLETIVETTENVIDGAHTAKERLAVYYNDVMGSVIPQPEISCNWKKLTKKLAFDQDVTCEVWETDCGQLSDCAVKNMKFCCYCGNSSKQI